MNFRRSIIIAKFLLAARICKTLKILEKYLHFLEKRPLTGKFSQFCSESFHHHTDQHVVLNFVKFVRRKIGEIMRSFVRSLLRAGVQFTLDPSAETFMSVQCASPGRGGELVGVCGVCASCVGLRKG